jgi:hypothetical protein
MLTKLRQLLTRTKEVTVSDALVALLHQAVDLGFASVSRDGEPFVVFAIFDTSEGGIIGNYVCETVAKSKEAARQDIRCLARSAYALAWDGYLTVDKDRHEAVFVEVSEPGMAQALSFAQRYTRHGDRSGKEKIGKIVFVGECDSALFGKTA